MAGADRIPESSTINKVVLNKALRSLALNLKAERWDQMFSLVSFSLPIYKSNLLSKQRKICGGGGGGNREEVSTSRI